MSESFVDWQERFRQVAQVLEALCADAESRTIIGTPEVPVGDLRIVLARCASVTGVKDRVQQAIDLCGEIEVEMAEYAKTHNPDCDCDHIHATLSTVARFRKALDFGDAS